MSHLPESNTMQIRINPFMALSAARRLWIMALAMVLVPGCTVLGDKEQTIKNYRLDKPERFNMPESLLEISGIALYKGKKDTFYAIQDEQGRLFRIAWGVKKQVNAKFGKQGDYEDLVIMNDRVIILKSNGHLFSFPFADRVYAEVDSVQEWKDILPKGEYEGMFGDEASGNIYVICKNCEGDNSKNMVSGYILHNGDSIDPVGEFQIDVNEIKAHTGKVKRGFRPSGIAKNPVTSEWFIISAVNKLLVVTDDKWKIKETCLLSSNIFNQPEGITFDSTGTLYISNEGDDLSEGNILKFERYK
jgi:hypothetical protein